MAAQPLLFIHHANDMYGADIGLLHSLQSLDRDKYYPIVILPSDMPIGMLSPELERRGIEYHFAPLGILRRKYLSVRHILLLIVDFVKGVAYVRTAARERGAVLVYVNTWVAVSGAIGGKMAGVPVIWHVREILSMSRPIRWLLCKALFLCSDRIICISKAVRDNLLKEAPTLARKSVVLYNAVTLASRDVEGGQLGLREEFGISPGVPLIATVGRITHWKGQEILVKAAASVLQLHPEAHFMAVGSYFADESYYLHKLESLINELGLNGRFHLTGYRSCIADVYRAFDVFVLASTKPEPFGRVTVEAMMQGLAVIATNHGGTCELIQEGVTGMLVPPSDPKSLAIAIDQLLADPELRERMGRAAASYAHQNFDLPRYQDGIRDVINQLVTSN
jgi:glycosyltransferase involved in cell wall biosynthesis